VEGNIRYNNGFGETVNWHNCWVILGTNFSPGDPARTIAPSASYEPVSCDGFERDLAKAISAKANVDRQIEREKTTPRK
jgi:hypothetical protein